MVGRIFWNVGAGLVHRALHRGAIAPGLGVSYPAVWRARPGFLDCDINLHLNNASYLFNMELARWHFSAVSGILWQAVKQRRVFLVGSQAIRYRHPIPPFRPYEIRTQVAYWDDDWIYFLHHFQCPTSGKVYAEGLCRATVRQGRQCIPGAQMLAEVDGVAPATPTEIPDVVKQFLEWDAACKASMEDQQRQLLEAAKAAPPADAPAQPRGFLQEWLRSVNLPF